MHLLETSVSKLLKMAPLTIKEKFDAKRANSPAAKRREREKAERDSKKPVLRSNSYKIPIA